MTVRRRTVLIVDDSPTVIAQLVGALEGTYTCLTAENGLVGLEAAREHLPDVVITDLEMPQLDGLGLLQGILSDPSTRQIPVVVLTTVTAVEKVNECRALGCAGFVLKPVVAEYLLAKLNTLMAVRKGQPPK